MKLADGLNIANQLNLKSDISDYLERPQVITAFLKVGEGMGRENQTDVSVSNGEHSTCRYWLCRWGKRPRAQAHGQRLGAPEGRETDSPRASARNAALPAKTLTLAH